LFAIFLQSLCIKLGTVTGLNLAENCKAHLPRWLNYVLYAFAEAAIIATDIAEVTKQNSNTINRVQYANHFRSLGLQLRSTSS
jgi:NRAMP (natural resistance-associated macrophage protein)-like metal ion transporter